MKDKHIYCIRCDTKIECSWSWDKEFDDDPEYFPVLGTLFKSNGNYGSNKFDPMDGSTAYLVVCNECFELLSKNIKVFSSKDN